MNYSAKPFVCPTAGCNMSFINEDHLTVHKKKHDMMLNLGINSKNNFFTADQTPTPTRFIRHCDEVGLFQDLHSDNPFEETFRRAVEDGKNGVLTVPEVNENDDTLHTPNIFSHITEECVPSASAVNKEKKSESLNELKSESNNSLNADENTKCKKESSDKNITNEINHSSDVCNLSNPPVEHSFINGSATRVPINVEEMQLLLKTEGGKVLRFVAAPAADSMNSVKIQSNQSRVKSATLNKNSNQSENTTTPDQKLSVAKIKLKQTLTKNGAVVENKSMKNDGNAPVDITKEKGKTKIDSMKKQAIKERNRASSMRARAKRKAWIDQLQNSLKTANETNANLHAQLKNLHNQIDKLKTLLLAHKDCPVTKAMEKGDRIVLTSKIISLKPNAEKSTSLNPPESVKPLKRANTEKLIAPKKKSITLPTVMSPIIIPTTDSSPNTITLHAAEAVKTIPTINIVTPLATNTGNGSTILSFIHTDPEKVKVKQSFRSSVDGSTVMST